MLAGARRVAAAAIKGVAWRRSVPPHPRVGHPTLIAPIRTSASDTAGHINNKPTADATSPPSEMTREPLSALFSKGNVRDGQRALTSGSPAIRRRSLYSTSADGTGPKTAEEGSPLAEAPRRSLSSLFARNPGRFPAVPPPASATSAPSMVPARQVSPPPPATTTGQQSATISLAGLFAGRPMPPPFAPLCPPSDLPFLNKAAPSPEHLEPLAKSPDGSLEELFDPVKFVQKYPFMVHVRPLFAQDAKYDKWMFTEIAKELSRSLPSSITQLNAKGLSYEKITLKDLIIVANLSNPEDISAKFLINVATKAATPETMDEDFQNSGQALKELMEISVGTPALWETLSEDITSFLAELITPLDVSRRYLTVNHSCLLPLEVMSQAYIICFEMLFRGRLPYRTAENICGKLPYSGDKWKHIAMQNPLFEKMLTEFRSYAGASQTLQAEWRWNASSHKTVYGDDYPPTAVDIMLQLYFPMFMVDLLRILFDLNMLIPLNLHRLFRR